MQVQARQPALPSHQRPAATSSSSWRQTHSRACPAMGTAAPQLQGRSTRSPVLCGDPGLGLAPLPWRPLGRGRRCAPACSSAPSRACAERPSASADSSAGVCAAGSRHTGGAAGPGAGSHAQHGGCPCLAGQPAEEAASAQPLPAGAALCSRLASIVSFGRLLADLGCAAELWGTWHVPWPTSACCCRTSSTKAQWQAVCSQRHEGPRTRVHAWGNAAVYAARHRLLLAWGLC